MDALTEERSLALLLCALAAIAVLVTRARPSGEVPTVGAGTSLLSTQVAAFRSLGRFEAWVREGYHKHTPGIFRVRLLRRWRYVVSGRALVDELRRAPEDVLSFAEATAHILQADYTLGDWREGLAIDAALIPAKLTRTLEQTTPSTVDEIRAAFEDEISSRLTGNSWTALTVGDAIMRIVCRAGNRVFVGLPLCRDAEYVDLCVKYALDVFISATILRNVPVLLRPFVSRYFTPIRRTHARAERLMSACITERLRRHADGAEDLPDDYLQWLIDTGAPHLHTVPALARHILRLNLAAIHSTAATVTFAVYQLAAHRDTYQEPIRREAEGELAAYGWTKAGLERLRLLDSFLRETQRFHGIGALLLDRIAMRDYTFADGSTVRAGQLVSAPVRATHRDPALYAQADIFDGFRFCDDPTARMTSPSASFLAFGSGRHACPGRFWAASTMKAIIAHIAMHYDLRTETEGAVPAEQWFGAALRPDRSARLLIRRRASPLPSQGFV